MLLVHYFEFVLCAFTHGSNGRLDNFKKWISFSCHHFIPTFIAFASKLFTWIPNGWGGVMDFWDSWDLFIIHSIYSIHPSKRSCVWMEVATKQFFCDSPPPKICFRSGGLFRRGSRKLKKKKADSNRAFWRTEKAQSSEMNTPAPRADLRKISVANCKTIFQVLKLNLNSSNPHNLSIRNINP